MAFDPVPKMMPVWREILGDGLTPVSAYARLAALPGPRFMFESVIGAQRFARYSFLGIGARMRVRAHLRAERDERAEAGADETRNPRLWAVATAEEGFRSEAVEGEAFEVLERLLERYAAHPVQELPRLWGGVVGVWGHDLVHAIEDIPAPAHGQTARLPALDLIVTDTLLIFDNLSQRVYAVSAACPGEDGGVAAAWDAAAKRVDRVVDALRRGPALPPMGLSDPRPQDTQAPRSEASRGRPFPGLVERAREAIVAGDVFQLVLSQRFVLARDGLSPLDIYRMLRLENPAPYMMLYDPVDGSDGNSPAALVAASPEVLVRLDPEDCRVTVRPIAGTRRRGVDEEEDLALEQELLSDDKERAEHVMLIDLGRNDVGRVSVGGSVAVRESFVIERYSRVMHMVSEVSGILAPGLGPLDALAAAFPAGTLSGAPKVRALELLAELEPQPREWYGGAVGYVGFDGGADFAIAIRAATVTADEVWIQAGAGIVYDSVPASEDDECERKAAAVIRAANLAKRGRETENPR